MNYYKRHLGDYAKDTGHLSALEHGVYTLLLDWYYVNEKPIPKTLAVRIARGNPDETQAVLSEFFKETPDGWIHSYADRVIEEYNAKAERNRISGAMGGRPKKTQAVSADNPSVTQTVSTANPDVTLATSHKPLAISHKEKKATPTGVDLFPGINPQVVSDFRRLRSAKKAAITQTAIDGISREAAKAGLTLEAALTMCCERGWTGFKADWVGGSSATVPMHERPGGGRRAL